MSAGRGLNPQAVEFVPKSWVSPACEESSDVNFAEASGYKEPAKSVVSYSSMLQRKATGTTNTTKVTRTDNGLGFALSLAEDQDLKSLLQNRRISAPKTSALKQHKDRWIELARKQGLGLRSALNERQLEHVAQEPLSEKSSHWHRVLGSTITTPIRTQSLLEAEEANKLQANVTHKEGNTRVVDARAYYWQWWTAVLQADYSAMCALIDTQRVSWDCTFDKELCDSALKLQMDELVGSVCAGIGGEAFSVHGLHALHVCALLPTHALCLEQFVQRTTVRVHLDSQERTHKRTALHYAAMAGNVEGVKILTSYGSDVALKSRNGNTALHFATRANNLAIMSLLCEKSRKVVNIRNKSSETALMLATSRSAVQILTNAGADLSSRNGEGMDVVTLAARAGNASLLDALLCCNASHVTNRTPASVNQASNPVPQVSQNFTTPLHQVARNGSMACLKLLLARCCSCLREDSATLCNTAASGRMANLLHDCGMHVLDRPAYYTPLMQAGVSGHAGVFAALLLHGASPSKQTLNSCTALTLAVAAPHVSAAFLEEVLKILKSYVYPVETLFTDNSLGWSMLACIALEALKLHKSSSHFDVDATSKRIRVLEAYVPKLALLVAHGAPICEDFLKLFADPACVAIVHQFGVDLRSPLNAWRAALAAAHLVSTLEASVTPSAQLDVMGRVDSYKIVQNCAQWVHEVDPPQNTGAKWNVPWGYKDVRVVLGSSEVLCHSFVLRTKRCGVLKSMLESELVRSEIIPEGEEGIGGARKVLAFPHVQAEVFSVLMRWVYTGKEEFCLEFLRSDKQDRTGGEWINEWVEQRRRDAHLVLELLYLSNELLMEELQTVCEVHLCRLHTALDAADVAHLVESIHCKVFGPFFRIGDTRALHEACAAMGVYSHMQEATVCGTVEQIGDLLYQATEFVDAFCESHSLQVPVVVEKLKRALRPARKARRTSAALQVNPSLADPDKGSETVAPDDSTVKSCLMKLMFALHCWLQRTSAQLGLTNHDVLLTCGERSESQAAVPAHRAILAAGSPKFAAMLRFVEAQGASLCNQEALLGENMPCNDVLCLQMDGMSSAAAGALSSFLYTQSLPRGILCGESEDVDNLLLELVQVADQHLLPELTAALSPLLIQHITAHNALQYFDVARTHGLSSVATLSALYWLQHCRSLGNEDGCADVTSLIEEMLVFLLCVGCTSL